MGTWTAPSDSLQSEGAWFCAKTHGFCIKNGGFYIKILCFWCNNATEGALNETGTGSISIMRAHITNSKVTPMKFALQMMKFVLKTVGF